MSISPLAFSPSGPLAFKAGTGQLVYRADNIPDPPTPPSPPPTPHYWQYFIAYWITGASIGTDLFSDGGTFLFYDFYGFVRSTPAPTSNKTVIPIKSEKHHFNNGKWDSFPCVIQSNFNTNVSPISYGYNGQEPTVDVVIQSSSSYPTTLESMYSGPISALPSVITGNGGYTTVLILAKLVWRT